MTATFRVTGARGRRPVIAGEPRHSGQIIELSADAAASAVADGTLVPIEPDPQPGAAADVARPPRGARASRKTTGET